VKYSRTAV